MSLRTEVESLAQDIGLDVKTLLGRAALPSYAPASTLKNPYDSLINVYNAKPSNLRETRAGLVRAVGGGKMNILTIGDSFGIGYVGSGSPFESDSFPRQACMSIARAIGVPMAGSGLQSSSVAASMVYADRWGSFTGTVDSSTYAATLVFYAGSSGVFTSVESGTSVELFHYGQSASFTVNIDGGNPITVTPNGVAAAQRTVVATGLADTPHTVKINASTNYVFLYGIDVVGAYVIANHNIAYGGSRAAHGNALQNWTSTSSNLYLGVKASFDLKGITPDLVMCVLGGNDILQGDTPANAIAGLSTIRGWYPNSDFLLIGGYEISGTNMTNWNDYWSRKYTLADTLDVPLLDLRHRLGDLSVVVANSQVGTDGAHPIAGVHREVGRNIAQVLTGDADGAKGQVGLTLRDNLAGEAIKTPVKTAAIGNITLSGVGQTVEGYVIKDKDRVLAPYQTTSADKGVYVAASGAWTRATDCDTADKLAGAIVPVEDGNWKGRTFQTTFTVNDVVGTTGQTWIRLIDSGFVGLNGGVAGLDGSGRLPLAQSTIRGVNAQTNTTYTFALADGGLTVTLSNAAAITATIPTNASVAFPIGTELVFMQLGAGQVTIAGPSVTLRPRGSALKTAGQNAIGGALKIGTDDWVIYGDMTA